MTYKTIDNKTLNSMDFGCKYIGQHVHIKMRFGTEKARVILHKLAGYRNDIKIACTEEHVHYSCCSQDI